MALINQFTEYMINLMINFGWFFGVILIILESIIPVLPLSVFIALNVASYGGFIGILISWISTIIGCSLSFLLFRKLFRNKIYKLIKKKKYKNLEKIMKEISNISFSSLVILMAIPFSPAFLINISSGLTKITYRKFLFALLIGKLIIVYFWGYIGSSLLESLTDITILIKVVILLLLAFVISTIVEKKLKIK